MRPLPAPGPRTAPAGKAAPAAVADGEHAGARAPVRAPAAEAVAELREKGSRFLAVVRPAGGEKEVAEALAALARRFPDATHLCWAARLGSPARERSSDAGEPAGTAGVPILQALRGAGLSDALAVVVRWFGGVKLGRGGLARAYSAATREALRAVQVVERLPRLRIVLSVPHRRVGAVKRLLRPPGIELEAEEYGGASAELTLAVAEPRWRALARALADLKIDLEHARVTVV
ncbi:MAG TPA: YigZ family protein [Thermoanaerobaculia bacterium]|nr:YigZ family protein [Thermoanaerobaculia bacterium]